MICTTLKSFGEAPLRGGTRHIRCGYLWLQITVLGSDKYFLDDDPFWPVWRINPVQRNDLTNDRVPFEKGISR